MNLKEIENAFYTFVVLIVVWSCLIWGAVEGYKHIGR